VKRALAALLARSAVAFGLRHGYRLLARGPLTIDLGVGRRLQPLVPLVRTIAASPDVVFDVIAGPYLGRTPARSPKLQVARSRAKPSEENQKF
jgi:hypothetical protein